MGITITLQCLLQFTKHALRFLAVIRSSCKAHSLARRQLVVLIFFGKTFEPGGIRVSDEASPTCTI